MDREFLVSVGAHTKLAFSVWLRGVEVAVRGYVEPADRDVGIIAESLVIEELRPVVAVPRWREPDIDDLLATGEYYCIERAFFETHDRWGDFEYVVHWGYDYDDPDGVVHERWLEYWMPWTAPGAGDQP